jgi:hypothetical protein
MDKLFRVASDYPPSGKEMQKVIHPSRKLLVVLLCYLGISGLSLGYGVVRINLLFVFLAAIILVITGILLHFSLSKYIIDQDGLYQIRKLTGVSFVPWSNVGRVFIEQGMVERWWGLGDLRIVGKDGRKLMRWRGLPQPQHVFELIRDTFARYAFLHQLPERPEI